MTKAVQDLMVEVERVRDAFHAALFARRDAAAALAVAASDCALENLPVGVGAAGEGLARFLADDVVPALPADLAFERVTRTVDRWKVVEESMVGFTHDRPMPWLLPGVGPTGRTVEVRAVSTVTVRRSRVAEHRTLWDLATLLRGLGLGLDAVQPWGAAPTAAPTASW